MHTGTTKTFMSELVIALALVSVAQDFVGLGALFELSFRFFVIRILVRMILHRQAPISTLDIISGSILAYAQNFIIVTFGHNFVLCATLKRSRRVGKIPFFAHAE